MKAGRNPDTSDQSEVKTDLCLPGASQLEQCDNSYFHAQMITGLTLRIGEA